MVANMDRPTFLDHLFCTRLDANIPATLLGYWRSRVYTFIASLVAN